MSTLWRKRGRQCSQPSISEHKTKHAAVCCI